MIKTIATPTVIKNRSGNDAICFFAQKRSGIAVAQPGASLMSGNPLSYPGLSLSMPPGPAALSLQLVISADLRRLNGIINNPAVVRFLDLIPPVSIERTNAFFSFAEEHGYLLWTIRMDGAEIIGCAGLLPEDPGTKYARTATFFLYLLPAFWGRGFGTCALNHLLVEARRRGLHRLECVVASTNDRAIRLYERHGFVQEGVKREAFYYNSRYEDLVMMAVLLD